MASWVGAFLFSGNRKVYVDLAFRFKTSPWRIYSLAHGRKVARVKDFRILQELEKKGVIRGVRPW